MSFCIKNTWCSHSERITTPNIIEPFFFKMKEQASIKLIVPVPLVFVEI